MKRSIYTDEALRHGLDRIMEFGRVIAVYPDGTVANAPENIHAPEIYWSSDEIGCASGATTRWSLLNGFSGQHTHNGPVMHATEQIIDALAEHIGATPGYYVRVAAADLGSDPGRTRDELDYAGWAVAYRELPSGNDGDEVNAGCDRCGTYDREPDSTLCRHCGRDELRERLRSLEAAFEHNGGRGVELAEEIDHLRAQLGDENTLGEMQAAGEDDAPAASRRCQPPARDGAGPAYADPHELKGDTMDGPTLLEEILASNDGSRLGAAKELAGGLMVGNESELKLGYDHRNAALAGVEHYGLGPIDKLELECYTLGVAIGLTATTYSTEIADALRGKSERFANAIDDGYEWGSENAAGAYPARMNV